MIKLLIVGDRGGTHIGGCLERAAVDLGLETDLLESKLAMEAPLLIRRFDWWLRGKRPSRLDQFSQKVLKTCLELRPQYLITTGNAPVNAQVLSQLRQSNILRINYLTDDPWNPRLFAPWFLKALPNYDRVFTPRRSNLSDLAKLGCSQVFYLPFAYAPELHFPESIIGTEASDRFASDVMFAGGADQDRIPYIAALLRQGLKVGLYGGYWERFSETRNYTRGHADPQALRRATNGSKICLCLVRRSNRDGHVMRSFEIPATGGCMLAEDTTEHHEIFGDEGRAVTYFHTVSEMVEKTRWLLEHENERKRLAASAYNLIVNGHNTYRDRLTAMLDTVGNGSA